jgi:hypothetical protein
MYMNSKYHSTMIKNSVGIVAVLQTSREIKMVLFYVSFDLAFIGVHRN